MIAHEFSHLPAIAHRPLASTPSASATHHLHRHRLGIEHQRASSRSLTTAFGAAQTTQLANQQNALDCAGLRYGSFTSALDTLQQSVQAIENPSQLAGFDATVADKTIATRHHDFRCSGGPVLSQVNNLATAATLTSAPLSSTAAGTGTLTIAGGQCLEHNHH